MAYRIVIELDEEMNLQHSCSLFNSIVNKITKRCGLALIKHACIQDTDYKTVLNAGQGPYFSDLVGEFRDKQEEEKRKEIEQLRTRMGMSIDGSDDAVN